MAGALVDHVLCPARVAVTEAAAGEADAHDGGKSEGQRGREARDDTEGGTEGARLEASLWQKCHAPQRAP